jgi:hypothetical protein
MEVRNLKFFGRDNANSDENVELLFIIFMSSVLAVTREINIIVPALLLLLLLFRHCTFYVIGSWMTEGPEFESR